MRSSARKYWVLRFLTVAAVVCISSLSVFGEDANAPPVAPPAGDVNAPPVGDVNAPPVGDVNKPPQEVSFEQRMQKKITVVVKNVPIETVIEQFREQANVNINTSPDVKGEVTVTLKDVTLEAALKSVLRLRNYDYLLRDNIIEILTADQLPKVAEKLETKTFEIVYADVKEVVKALKEIVSKPPNGTVSSIEGTSHIIVTDTESKIRDISTFIEKIDRMTPQILVEARIYDITSKDKLDLGVEWNAGRDTTYYSDAEGTTIAVPPGTMGAPKTGDIEPFTTGIFRGDTKKISSTTGVLKFGWLKDGVDIDAIIKAQQENIDIKLLANPRILVLDNEKASINIISEIPYMQLTSTQLGGSTASMGFKEVGVKLEVTPHVAVRDEMIRLQLKPVFSIRGEDMTVPGYSGNYPVVDRREAETKLLVKNGQTVVLGGLRKKNVTKQINKVPLLGDLPLAGALFRFTGEDTVNSEIVVFVTPWIIKQPVVLSQGEQDAYKITDFKGPEPTMTKAEKPEKAKE